MQQSSPSSERCDDSLFRLTPLFLVKYSLQDILEHSLSSERGRTHLATFDPVLDAGQINEQRPLRPVSRDRILDRIVVMRTKMLSGRILVHTDVRVERARCAYRVWIVIGGSADGRGVWERRKMWRHDWEERVGECWGGNRYTI